MFTPPESASEILEIGYISFFKRLMPTRTTFVAVESANEEQAAADLVMGGPATDRILRLMTDPRFGVVVLRVNHHPGSDYGLIFRLLAGVEQRPWPAFPWFRRSRHPASPSPPPLVILDFEDEAFIHAQILPLIGRAVRYYKRELPADRWRVLASVGGEARDESVHRDDREAERVLEKISPLPLGLPLDNRRFLFPETSSPKTCDIFFAGRIEGSSWLRRQGFAELETLAHRGVSVDIAASGLEPAAFYRRCAAAWLAWSPQGYGWDCFRHYEAAACRSVPVINYPSIERHRGLVHGSHAVFYDPAPGGLTAAIETALAEKPRLARMGEAGRAHVLSHGTPEATAVRILDEAGVIHGRASDQP